MTRKYSSISVETTLASGLSGVATSMIVAAGTGVTLVTESLAAGNVDQFTVAIDPDTINEEIVFVTGLSGDTLTIVRGRAGTSNITHSGGAKIKHVLTSDDLNAYATLTGAQTLASKTLSNATLAGTLNAGGGNGTNGQTLTSTGTGVHWTTPSSIEDSNIMNIMGAF